MIESLAFATGNRDKVREISQYLSGVVTSLYWQDHYPTFHPPEETGATLRENARLKAQAFHAVTGIPTCADDTGLFVEALDGRPGVHSARYAGLQSSYRDNLELLLTELGDVPLERRQASFRTEICCVWSGGEHFLSGSCEGIILLEPEAIEGAFGYDPVFQPRGSDRPFSCLSLMEKNRISHRGRALAALVQWLTAVDLKGETG